MKYIAFTTEMSWSSSKNSTQWDTACTNVINSCLRLSVAVRKHSG